MKVIRVSRKEATVELGCLEAGTAFRFPSGKNYYIKCGTDHGALNHYYAASLKGYATYVKLDDGSIYHLKESAEVVPVKNAVVRLADEQC